MVSLHQFNDRFRDFVDKYYQQEERQHTMPDSSLTTAEVHLIVLVSQQENIGLSEIANRWHVSRSAVTQLVSKAVAKGNLKKTPSHHKKSALQLSLTASGREVVTYHRQQHEFLETRLQMVLANYPSELLDDMYQLMTDIEKVWDELLLRNKEEGVHED